MPEFFNNIHDDSSTKHMYVKYGYLQ